MPYGHVGPDRERKAGVGVQHRAFLDIAAFADDKRFVVPTQDGTEPNPDIKSSRTFPMTCASGAIQNRPTSGKAGSSLPKA